MYKMLLVVMALTTIKVSSATTGLIATSRQRVENRETKPSTFNKTNKAGTPRRIIVDGEL